MRQLVLVGGWVCHGQFLFLWLVGQAEMVPICMTGILVTLYAPVLLGTILPQARAM